MNKQNCLKPFYEGCMHCINCMYGIQSFINDMSGIQMVNIKKGTLYNIDNVNLECTNGQENKIKINYISLDSNFPVYTREFNEFFKKFKISNSKITLEIFNSLPANTIFAKGVTFNSPDYIYMTDSYLNRPMKWLAVKGTNNDWCIYTHWLEKTFSYIRVNGDKIITKDYILKLLPDSEYIINKYRF